MMTIKDTAGTTGFRLIGICLNIKAERLTPGVARPHAGV